MTPTEFMESVVYAATNDAESVAAVDTVPGWSDDYAAVIVETDDGTRLRVTVQPNRGVL